MTSQATGKTALVLALAIVTLGVAFGAAAASSLPHGDAAFLKKAAADGVAEVQLAQLAREKAMREEVRQFAQMLLDDHSKANSEIQSIAAGNGVELPSAPDREHAKALKKLQELVGGDFDRAYMQHMVKDHKHDVKEFRREAKSKKQNDVTQFAARTLPVLQAHLDGALATSDIAHAAKRSADRETGSTKK